jgi:hypothetical protein
LRHSFLLNIAKEVAMSFALLPSVGSQPIVAPALVGSPGIGSTAQLDANVKTAWENKRLTDGTKLDLGRTDQEQGFIVKPEGTFAVNFRQSGTQKCNDGSERRVGILNTADITPHAGGHTHPKGKTGDILGLPGPEDGQMAAKTRMPAYVISAARAYAIDKSADGTFTVRVIAGESLSPREKGDIQRSVEKWNLNNGGSGAQCRFIPDSH